MSVLANNPAIARNLRNVFLHPYTREDALFYIEKAREGAWGIKKKAVLKYNELFDEHFYTPLKS